MSEAQRMRRRTKWTLRRGERLGIRQGASIVTLEADGPVTLTFTLEESANVWRIPADGIVKPKAAM